MIKLNQINGNKVKDSHICTLKDKLKNIPTKKVVVIKFKFRDIFNNDVLLPLPTEVSTKNKIQSFQKAGIDASVIELSSDIKKLSFTNVIKSLNNNIDIIGILVQHKIPNHIISEIKYIDPRKDIDGITKNGVFRVSAVSESAIRIFDYIYEIGNKVAVVGAKGYVGKDVVEQLDERNISYTALDIGDDISVLKDYKIIITAVGKAGVINQYINNFQYVIDIGFSIQPLPHYHYSGDVSNKYDGVTPVPEGLGPLSIATLIERVSFLGFDINIKNWELNDAY